MRTLRGLGIAFVLSSGLLTVASSLAAESGVHQVTIERESFLFAPQALSIRVGDRVRWTNHDGQMHMVVTAKPDSDGRELELYHRLDPDATFEYQFNTAAAYHYYCAIHFQMWGIISVNP
ncbi:MAG: plastocyanin/azurin family copper-binding protein [Nitrospirota bacterium]